MCSSDLPLLPLPPPPDSEGFFSGNHPRHANLAWGTRWTQRCPRTYPPVDHRGQAAVLIGPLGQEVECGEGERQEVRGAWQKCSPHQSSRFCEPGFFPSPLAELEGQPGS